MTATGFSEFLPEFFEVFGALLPVFELLQEGFALQLLPHSFGALALHANTVKGLRHTSISQDPIVSGLTSIVESRRRKGKGDPLWIDYR